MKRPAEWFAFPTDPDAVHALAEAHVGKEVIGLSTPLAGEPGISLVQVLTFVDPVLGFRHLFAEETCRAFNQLALSIHAGLHVPEQLALAALVRSTQTVARVFGASQEELFLLVPTRVASLVTDRIQELLEPAAAIVNPWGDTPRATRREPGERDQ